MKLLIFISAGLTLVFYILSIFRMKKEIYIAIFFNMLTALLFWKELTYPPFINGYGSMIFFSLMIALKSLFNLPFRLKRYLVLASLLMIAGSFFMPYKLKSVEAVLASIWLGIHVPLFFMGYLSLTTSFFASFINGCEKLEKKELKYALFFIFTGILSGSYWAEISWARYWGWDSKEVFALSTWLLIASYFHFDDKRERLFVLRAAFVSMILTYVVVSFVIPGMHSYM